MSGWFSVKRGITKHPIFYKRPERLAIWLWLLDNACWADTKHDINGKIVTVPRGSVSVSERRIADEVGVGRQVVRTFLQLLTDQHMINPSPTHGKRVISLCNWDKYQKPAKPTNPATNPELTQDQPTKETSKQIPTSSGADAPPSDPVKIMFDEGRKILMSAGKSSSQAGKILGRWRSDHGTEAVISALGRAQREGAIDPVSFVEGALRFVAKKHTHPEIGEIREVGGVRKQYCGNGTGWLVIHD